MTTLLSMCTAALQDCGFASPASLIGNFDETALRVVAAAQFAGKSLYKAPQGGWVANIKENDFTTVAISSQSGTVANSGPNGTAVISGLSTTTGITANAWYAFGTGLPSNSIVTNVTSSTVTINQAASQTGAGNYVFGQSDYAIPSDFHRLVDETLWDRSRFWAMRGPMSPQQWQLYKSSVIGKASIQRRWRLRYKNGAQVFSVDPVPTDNGSALVFEYVSNAWCQSSTLTPQTQWLADTDTPILDDELITLGIRWRVKRGLGFSYQEELDEYERELRKAIARDGGAPILNMTPSNHLTVIGPWNIPETGFGGTIGS